MQITCHPCLQNVTMPAPALALTGAGLAVAETSGNIRDISPDEALAFLNEGNAIICHASWFMRRMGARPKTPAYDILELLAFVHPARHCLPSPAGIASALNLPTPEK